MISALAPRTLTSAPARLDQATPQPPASPAPPADQADISRIDTAAKAAALPIMDPAVQLGLAAGVAAIIYSAMAGGGVPLITLDVLDKAGSKHVHANYTLDAKDQQSPIKVSGDLSGEPVSGGLKVDEEAEKVSWQGQLGQNAEELHFAADPENEALRVECKFGEVEGSLEFTPIRGQRGDDDFKGYRVEGTLGGQPYFVDTTFELPEDLQRKAAEGERLEAKMHASGKLGDLDISKDYTIVGQQTGSGLTIEVNGSGTTAGIPQEVSVNLAIIP